MSIRSTLDKTAKLVYWNGEPSWPIGFEEYKAELALNSNKFTVPPPCWDCRMGEWVDDE